MHLPTCEREVDEHQQCEEDHENDDCLVYQWNAFLLLDCEFFDTIVAINIVGGTPIS